MSPDLYGLSFKKQAFKVSLHFFFDSCLKTPRVTESVWSCQEGKCNRQILLYRGSRTLVLHKIVASQLNADFLFAKTKTMMCEKSNKLLVINGRALSDKECAVIVIIWEEYLTVKSLFDFFINKRTLLH